MAASGWSQQPLCAAARPAQPNHLRRTAPPPAHPGTPAGAGPATARGAARACSRRPGGRHRSRRWAQLRCRGGTCRARAAKKNTGAVGTAGVMRAACLHSPPAGHSTPPPVLPAQQEGRQLQRRQPHKQRAQQGVPLAWGAAAGCRPGRNVRRGGHHWGQLHRVARRDEVPAEQAGSPLLTRLPCASTSLLRSIAQLRQHRAGNT